MYKAHRATPKVVDLPGVVQGWPPEAVWEVFAMHKPLSLLPHLPKSQFHQSNSHSGRIITIKLIFLFLMVHFLTMIAAGVLEVQCAVKSDNSIDFLFWARDRKFPFWSPWKLPQTTIKGWLLWQKIWALLCCNSVSFMVFNSVYKIWASKWEDSFTIILLHHKHHLVCSDADGIILCVCVRFSNKWNIGNFQFQYDTNGLNPKFSIFFHQSDNKL